MFAIAPKAGRFVNFRRDGGEIDIWDLPGGRLLRSVPVGEGAVEQWAFSDDEKEMKFAGGGRSKTRLDLAGREVTTDRANGAAFAPFRSSARGRAFHENATVEDGAVTTPVQIGLYVQQHFPRIEPLAYFKHPDISTPESFVLSDDGDYALAHLNRTFCSRRPISWRELNVFRLSDGKRVARFRLEIDLGPISHFASDGCVLLIGDVWGGVSLFPLVEGDVRGRQPEAVFPLWSVLAPKDTAPTALIDAFRLQSEKSEAERRLAEARASALEMRERYRWPAPDPQSEIVVCDDVGALGYSSVTHDDGVPTVVSDIVIEPGVQPLHLVLNASLSTIWRVSGAAERVQKMIVATTSPSGASGVMGLSRDQVFFSRYFPSYERGSVRPDENERRALRNDLGFIYLTGLLGREPDVFAQARGAPRIALPGTPVAEGSSDGERPDKARQASVGGSRPRANTISILFEAVLHGRSLAMNMNVPEDLDLQHLCVSGTLEKIGEKHYRILKTFNISGGVASESGPLVAEGSSEVGRPKQTWATPFHASDRRFNLIEIDPEEVVAERPVRPYVNLPGDLGLRQLCASGALEKIDEKRYRVLKKIRIPAGVYWRVQFLLAPGVEAPDGNAGERDSVVREDTGERVETFRPKA